jgi:HEAT repeat protein
MFRTTKSRIGVTLIVLFAISFLVVLLRNHEPRYQNRSLTEWLQRYSVISSANSHELAEVQRAVLSMNREQTIRFLLRAVRSRPNPVNSWIYEQVTDFGINYFQMKAPESQQALAIAGFQILSNNAAPAVPQLTSLLRNRQTAFVSVFCLGNIGPPAESGLDQALTNSDAIVRQHAIVALNNIIPEPERLVARLTNSLANSNAMVRATAVQALGSRTNAPEIMIPILFSLLHDTNMPVAFMVARAFADFGTNATSALPTLRTLVQSPDPRIGANALRAMSSIAPEEALPFVLHDLNAPESFRRRRAAILLTRYDPPTSEILSALKTATTDADPRVASNASLALAVLRHETNVALPGPFLGRRQNGLPRYPNNFPFPPK